MKKPAKKSAAASRRKKSRPEARQILVEQAAVAPARKDGQLLAPAEFARVWELIEKRRPPAEFRIPFVRADDFLVCDFVFENLQLSAANADGKTITQLVRKNPNAPAILIAEFPPQSFGEEAFLAKTAPEVPGPLNGKEKYPPTAVPKNTFEAKADDLGPLPSARIRMSGRSRIAFAMPAEEKSLEFTTAAILAACQRWPMRLDVNAVPDQPGACGPRTSRIRIFDLLWLDAVLDSAHWKTTRASLITAAGGGAAVTEPLTNSARRIAFKTVEALQAGNAQGIGKMMQRAMNEELDVLAQDFAPIREGDRRHSALAALSLMTTQALLAHEGIGSVIDRFGDLPFFPFIFGPHEPGRNVTALELPYRLLLSPVPNAFWRHAIKPVTHRGRTELWHTRLVGTSDGALTPTNVRAIWSPDYPPGDKTPEIISSINKLQPFRMSLDRLDRQMLVRLMAGFDKAGQGPGAFHPCTARSRRLALSALGAQIDVEGSWYKPNPVDLEQWRHLATFGRDHYVRVVYRGFLCDLGHAASLVKVTERKFESLGSGSGNRVAVLRQRFFIIVREQVKQYSGDRHQFGGRNFPFTSVEVLTRVTPSLVAPDNAQTHVADASIYTSIPNRACFWPMINGTPNEFLFQIAATDLCGERVTFAMPLLFVGFEANKDAGTIDKIVAAYRNEKAQRRTGATGNAAICFAPRNPAAEGDTRLPTGNILFTAARLSGTSEDAPNFYPEIETAHVGIAAIQRLLQQPNFQVDVAYPDVYKNTPGGFGGANPGEVFLKLVNPKPLAFGGAVKSDAIGGLATPDMAVQGLSRIMGPVSAQETGNVEAALANVIGNKFNPADFFKGAKILGGVELSTILNIATTLVGADVPKLLSQQLPDRIEARFDWNTQINKSDPLGLFVPNAGGPTKLEMHGVITSPIGKPNATTFHANASLVNFKVNLFGFITIWFDALRFSSETGKKPDVAVELHQGEDAIAFGGPLEFVNELRKIIPSNGFSDPPSLSVTPSGIQASYSINIPSLAVGIFALEHLSLGAGFSLPFDANPAEVRFNFSERQRPFSLTVSMLGGGGFLLLGIGTEGVKEIEAALEFGAAVSINLGVASGSVEIKAGVYFHWLQPASGAASVELAGYVRLHGELSVLGLISASLTFNLQLAYLKEGGRSLVYGEATLEVEIDILFFSASVSVKCRKEFGGSPGDPKFIELIPTQSVWDEYCGAFAKEAA